MDSHFLLKAKCIYLTYYRVDPLLHEFGIAWSCQICEFYRIIEKIYFGQVHEIF